MKAASVLALCLASAAIGGMWGNLTGAPVEVPSICDKLLTPERASTRQVATPRAAREAFERIVANITPEEWEHLPGRLVLDVREPVRDDPQACSDQTGRVYLNTHAARDPEIAAALIAHQIGMIYQHTAGCAVHADHFPSGDALVHVMAARRLDADRIGRILLDQAGYVGWAVLARTLAKTPPQGEFAEEVWRRRLSALVHGDPPEEEGEGEESPDCESCRRS